MADLEKCPHCGGSLKTQRTEYAYCGQCNKMSMVVRKLKGHTLESPKVIYTCKHCNTSSEEPACLDKYMEPATVWTDSAGGCSQGCPHRYVCHLKKHPNHKGDPS